MRGWILTIAMETESRSGSQEGLHMPKGKSTLFFLFFFL